MSCTSRILGGRRTLLILGVLRGDEGKGFYFRERKLSLGFHGEKMRERDEEDEV